MKYYHINKKNKINWLLITYLVLIVIIFQIYSVNIQAESRINVEINGVDINFEDVKPTVINNRTLVPLRKIFESLGLEVEWIGETQTIIGTKENLKIQLVLGSKQAKVNNEIIILDVEPQIINNTTLVPARFIAESTGAKVEWNGDTGTVVITSMLDKNMLSLDYLLELPIKINGILIDNKTTNTPFLTYNNVTYIPLTKQYCQALGIDTCIENQHLIIKSFPSTEKIKQDLIYNNNTKTLNEAKIINYDVTINKTNFKNSEIKYPLLEVNNNLYLPLSSQLINELNWIVDTSNDLELIIYTPSTDVTHLLLPSCSQVLDNSKNINEKGLSVGVKYKKEYQGDYKTKVTYNIIIHNGYSKDVVNGKFNIAIYSLNPYTGKYDVRYANRNFSIDYLKAGDTIIVTKEQVYSYLSSSDEIAVKPFIRDYQISEENNTEYNFAISDINYQSELGLVTGKINNSYNVEFKDIKLNILFTKVIESRFDGIDGYYENIIDNQTLVIDKLLPNSKFEFHMDVTKDIKYYNIYTSIIPQYEIFRPENEYEIVEYLEENFGIVNTSIGEVELEVSVKENESKGTEYDYWIQVDKYRINGELGNSVFRYIKDNKNITPTIRNKVLKEMKDHMEKLARSIIDVMPEKKFYGCYYKWLDEYPNLKYVGGKSISYNTWSNYKNVNRLVQYEEIYNNAKLSEFHWVQSHDD